MRSDSRRKSVREMSRRPRCLRLSHADSWTSTHTHARTHVPKALLRVKGWAAVYPSPSTPPPPCVRRVKRREMWGGGRLMLQRTTAVSKGGADPDERIPAFIPVTRDTAPMRLSVLSATSWGTHTHTQAHAHLRPSTPAVANTAARQYHAHLRPTATTHSCARSTGTALWCPCCQLTACGHTSLSPCRFTGRSCTRTDSRTAPSKFTAASGCARPGEYKAVCEDCVTTTVAREIKDTLYTRHGVNVPATGSPLVIDMGFNVGLCRMLVLEVNPQAVVLAAEPILRLCAVVKENAARYRQRV